MCTTVNLWSVFRAFLSEYCPFYRYHFTFFLCSKRFLEWVILVGSPRTYPRSTVRAKSPPGGGPFYFEFKPAGIDWS